MEYTLFLKRKVSFHSKEVFNSQSKMFSTPAHLCAFLVKLAVTLPVNPPFWLLPESHLEINQGTGVSLRLPSHLLHICSCPKTAILTCREGKSMKGMEWLPHKALYSQHHHPSQLFWECDSWNYDNKIPV